LKRKTSFDFYIGKKKNKPRVAKISARSSPIIDGDATIS